MNPVIKELIKQATTEEHDGFLYFDKKKFAELIVRECARISVEADDTMTNQGEASAQAFMEHFGVGE